MSEPDERLQSNGLTPKIGKVATRELANHGFTTYD